MSTTTMPRFDHVELLREPLPVGPEAMEQQALPDTV